ncbi:hypothetical protein [Gillisia sp. JM1]|uniref:hypothetical protein n=1 Tax=Gillisia sp. JM1 TaxID=1283286 RepID=UPI00041C6AEE|nr:hypothetical protein [Gillisia sp. JM1]
MEYNTRIFIEKFFCNNLFFCLVVLIYFFNISSLFSQENGITIIKEERIEENTEKNEDLISVFLDCPCDNAYVRQELNFVNFARDPQLAKLHLFVTRQNTGSGGRLYTLSFIGKEEFEGVDNNLSYTSVQTNTQDEERKGITAMLKLGLIPYIAQTSLAENITVDITGIPETRKPDEDPWNNWIFEVYGGLSFTEETSTSSLDIRYGFSADYVTETWRIRLRPYFNYNQRDYVKDEENIRSVLHRNGFNGRVVRSISDHWSTGIFTNIISNTYENIEFGYRVAPAIEYSLLPYKEALRTEYTVAYSIGFVQRNYLEETIYDKVEESLYNHSLQIGVRVLEPWGTVRAGVEGSHYLHDLNKNRLSLNGRLSLRVFQGLSVDFYSRYDYVRDQLSLPKGDTSLEDVLLQQRQLATTYGVSLSIGLGYSFGSIYNNVVNTRL